MEISLITSAFAGQDLNVIPAEWPVERTKNVELYAFMHEHLTGLLQSKLALLDSHNCALRALADVRDVDIVANSIDEACQAQSRDLKIVAVSSFLPEIMAPEFQESAWRAAQNALITLVRLIRALRKLGHPAKVLELVGGSGIDGIWPAVSDRQASADPPAYIMNMLGPDEAIVRLVERLRPVGIEAVGEVVEDDVLLGLEMEPGCLFTVGDFESVVRLCSYIDSIDQSTHSGMALFRVLGVNLDIPHFAFLAGVDLAQLEEQPGVVRRIVHAHISDHERGHFCDAVPGSLHPLKTFKSWVSWLEGISNQKKMSGFRLPFSGFISCELECAYQINDIKIALERIGGLIAEL